MGTATFILVLALAASQATAVNILVPLGKELIYDYQSVVKAGILTGTSYSSLFVLHGQLILFGHDDMIEVRLNNLTYTLHNGEVGLDTTIPLQEITVPYEVEDLLKPFRIQYDVEGRVVGIYTDVNELEYSKNIKRALATILQLDRRVSYDCKDVCSFVTMEDSIYGMDKVNYNVMMRDRDIVVQKMLERSSSKQLFQHVITNIFRPHSVFHVDHPLVRDCQKKYVIGSLHGTPVIKKITSEGGIYFTPFRTLGDTQYLLVTQTLRLIDITEVRRTTFVKDPVLIKTLKYHIDYDYIKYGMIPDVRMITDVKTIYPVVYTMLKDIVMKLGVNPILEVRPDIYRSQLINRLHSILIRLDVVAMRELHVLLTEKHVDTEVIEVFYQVLPLVGTRASVILIKDLIVEKLVSERIMLHLLHVFPFHVRVTTGKLLLEVEELLMLKKDFPVTVYRASVLCYTTLIRRIRENFKNTMLTTVVDDTDVHLFMKKIDVICEKYLHYLINRMLTTTDYDMQQVYIGGIFNTKMRLAGLLLRKFLFNDKIHHNLRVNMMWTIGHTLKDVDTIFTVFWPILTNRDFHLEYRGIALYTLLKCHPTTTRLLNLVWYMDTERNTELYNIFYTYLHVILKTTDVSKFELRERVVKIIRLVRRPDIRARSGFFALDYKDPIHNFGCTFRTFMMVTDRSQYIKIVTHGHLLGIPINYFNMVFRIEGLTVPLTEIIDINRLLVSRTSLFNMEEIVKLVTVLKSGGVKLEVDILVQDQLFYCKYFDNTNVADLWRIMSDMTLFTLMKEYVVKINYNIFTTIMLPTDMGTLGMLDVKIPSLKKHIVDVKHDFTGGKMMMDLNMNIRESLTTTYGLTMYNPIVNVWQGVRKVKVMDVVLPIRMGFVFDLNTKVFNIVFKRTTDVVRDTVGLRTYVTGFVFLYKDIIHYRRDIDLDVKTRDLVVIRHEVNKKENVIIDEHDINTGLNYQVLTMDCDRPFTRGMLRKLFSLRRNVLDSNFHTNLGYWYMTVQNMYDYFLYHPCVGTCGIIFRGLPSKVYPVGEMELTFKFIPDVKITRDILLPGIKLDSRIVYTVKTFDLTPLKVVDLILDFDVNEGQTLSTMKMILLTKVHGHKDERIWIEGMKKWTDRDVTGHLKVIYGISGVTEEPVMLINMHGGLLEDQTVGKDIRYGRCDLGIDYHPFKCLMTKTSLRRYDYDIKLTKRVPIVIRQILDRLFTHLKVHYDYDVIDTKDMVVPDDTIKVRVVYPLIGKVMDMKVLTTTEKFMVSNIPVYDWRWLGRGFNIGVTPMFLVLRNYDINDILLKGITWLGHGMDNTRISPMYNVIRKWGFLNTCKVTPYTLKHLTLTKRTSLLEGWHMLIGEVTTKSGIFVKRLDVHDLLVLKIVLQGTDLEIVPVGDGMFKFIHNGVVVPFDKIYTHRMNGGMYDRYLYDDVVKDKSYMMNKFDDVFHIKKRGIYDERFMGMDDKFDFIHDKKYGMLGDKYGKDVDYWLKYKTFLLKHKIPFTTKYFDMFMDRYNVDSMETMYKYRTPIVHDKFKKHFDIYGMDSKENWYNKDMYDTKRKMPFMGMESREDWYNTKDIFDTKHKMPFTKKFTTMDKLYDVDSKEFNYMKYKDLKTKTPWKRDIRMFGLGSTEHFDSKEHMDTNGYLWLKYKDFLMKHKIPFTTKYFDMFKTRYNVDSMDTMYKYKTPIVHDKFKKHFDMYGMDSTEDIYNTKYRTPFTKNFMTKDKLYDVDSKEFNYMKYKDIMHKTPLTYPLTDKFYDVDYKKNLYSKEMFGSGEHFGKYTTPMMKKRLLKDTLFGDVSREHMDSVDMPWMKKHYNKFYDVGSTERFVDSKERLDFVNMPWFKKYHTKMHDVDSMSMEHKFVDSKEFLDSKLLDSRERYMKYRMPLLKKHMTLKDKLYDVDFKDITMKGKYPYKRDDTFFYKTHGVDRTMSSEMGSVEDHTVLRGTMDKYIRDNTCWGTHCMTRIITGTYNFGGVTVDIVGRTVFITTPKMTVFLQYNGRDVLIDYYKMKDYEGMCFETVY